MPFEKVSDVLHTRAKANLPGFTAVEALVIDSTITSFHMLVRAIGLLMAASGVSYGTTLGEKVAYPSWLQAPQVTMG